ncbi:MAG: hypothetical protein M9894_01970 [Planctomycetes bacterium]|nr:hypothetical protein [Planctomycetota bacterium]
MNFLAHHHLDRSRGDPWYAAGVAVPDLWPRFRRRGRPGARLEPLRVAPGEGDAPAAARLRAGLARHEEVDRAFHGCAAFLAWRRAAAARAEPLVGRSARAGLLAHVGVELVLDRWLLLRDPALGPGLYALLEQVPPAALERALVDLGVDAAGFAAAFEGFVAARHLLAWTDPAAVAEALARTVALLGRPGPPAGDLRGFVADVEAAIARGPARPEAVAEWVFVPA